MCACVCACPPAVRASDRVRHFKVLKAAENDFHVDLIRHFGSLMDLVQYYRNNSLNNCGILGNPCRRVRPPVLRLQPSPNFSSSFMMKNRK